MRNKAVLNLLLTALFIVTLLNVTACTPPVYSKSDLISQGAVEVTGTIVSQGTKSFILETSNHKKLDFNIGMVTQYLPPDYRSQVGDQVRVAYKSTMSNFGVPKQAVLQLESIQVPDYNQPLKNPILGEVVKYGKGGTSHAICVYLMVENRKEPIKVFIPDFGAEIYIGNSSQEVRSITPQQWNDMVGHQAKVVAERKILRAGGNGYYYDAKEINFKNRYYSRVLKSAEERYIDELLRSTNGDISLAAKQAGMNENVLRQKIQRYKIETKDDSENQRIYR